MRESLSRIFDEGEPRIFERIQIPLPNFLFPRRIVTEVDFPFAPERMHHALTRVLVMHPASVKPPSLHILANQKIIYCNLTKLNETENVKNMENKN